MIRRIDHIELIVRNVDEFVRLFELMGFEVVLRTEHHGGSAEVKLPGPDQPVFEIHQVEGEENPGINHIAFRVDDVQAAYAQLANAGVRFDRAPGLVPQTGRVIANFRDPDGWRLQLVDARRESPV
ncbi:MAG: VOC family protein [Chloroflexi bacterium]|nr:VOC family protein [Chloroflexota bacterium]